MLTAAFRARRHADSDSGYAMLMVIASVLIMTIMGAGALVVATQQQTLSRRDQDYNGAYQAAQSGVEDYLARLQANANYWTNGNVDANNPAFTSQTQVPGTASGATFQYSIDTSTVLTQGYMTLTSIGRVNGKQRKLTTKLGKQSFLNYMYFTQYETIDPVAYASAPPANTCDKYAYTTAQQTTPRVAPAQGRAYCALINFIDSDTLKGPVYSQDKINLTGDPTFTDTFKTGWLDPAGVYYNCNSQSACNPTFSNGRPSFALIDFPKSNDALRPYADPSVGGTGCLFQGPTSMVFHAPVSPATTGTVTIKSPYTPSGTSTGACGTHNWGTASGQTITVPTGQVIWVDANSTSCSSMPVTFPYPVPGDLSSGDNPPKLKPSCANGDAYVSGWVKGQLTIGTTNNIFITNQLRYVGSNSSANDSNLATGIPTNTTVGNSGSVVPATDINGTDVLGLSAANFVQVYHPLDDTDTSKDDDITTAPYPLTNLLIDAAIVASRDSFLVSDWDKGPAKGVLSLKGALIQQYRGPVGTSSNGSVVNGYAKNYEYDPRLPTLNPPHLADLAASSWISVAQYEGPSN